MAEDILDKLNDLLKQATTERSHYYVASCCRESIAEIKKLRGVLAEVAADYQSPPCVMSQAAGYLIAELERRATLAANAL